MSSERQSIGAVAIVLALVLVGCVGGTPGEGATPASTPSPTDTPVETTASGTDTPANGTLVVHFINVGQSVSTLVVAPGGETMLVDTGHYHDDGEYVLDYLQEHGIERIDHLVVSHNDADHIGGNAAIIEYYETSADGIGAVYDPGIAASTQTYAVTLYERREGDPVDFGTVDVQVLGPPEPYLENEARNENSVVLRLGYGETSFLVTGDAEDDQEEYLVSEYGQALNATVLKVGHHGSSSSTSGQLLDAVRPQAVVISSAYDSQYGHPTEEVLERLADRSIPAYWTATHGNVVLVSGGEGVSVRTQRAAPTDPTAIRDAEPAEPRTTGPVSERARLGGFTATPTMTTVATDGGTADGELVVDEIHADAAGDERENLDDEYVVFANDGDAALDLTGWTVEDEAGGTYTFPEGFTLEAGERVTLHTGSGTDTERDLYWGSGSPIWNNGGDTVIVRNSQGDVVREVSYP